MQARFLVILPSIQINACTTRSAHLTNRSATFWSYLLGSQNGTWEAFKHLSSIRIIQGQILQRDGSVLGPAFGWKNVSTVTCFGLELCVSQYSLDRNHRWLGIGQMETNRRKSLVQLYHKAKYKATQSWKLTQIKDTNTLKCFGEGLTKKQLSLPPGISNKKFLRLFRKVKQATQFLKTFHTWVFNQ